MNPRWVASAAGVVVIAAGCAWIGTASRHDEGVLQPMEFSHAVHVKGEELACNDCHAADREARAGFPDIKDCYQCHVEARGDEPDESLGKVREYGKAKKQIPWVQVNRNVGHVYFSHRAHVAFGGMKCDECHGDMSAVEKAVTHRTESLHRMGDCMTCHQERGASLECLACHD